MDRRSHIAVLLTGLVVAGVHAASMAQDPVPLAPGWSRTIEPPSAVYEMYPSAEDGVFVVADDFIATFARDGRERWRYPPCTGCGADPVFVSLAQPTRDGGAWIVQQDRYWPTPVARAMARLDGRGQVIVRTPLAAIPSDRNREEIRLVADDDEATVWWSSPYETYGTIGWTRATIDGEATTGHIALAAGSKVGLQKVRRLHDGDFLLAFDPDAWPYLCTLKCIPDFTTLMRVSAHGVPRWRYDAAFENPRVLLDDSGSSWLAANAPPITVQSISPAGSVVDTLSVAGLPPPFAGLGPDHVEALPGHLANRLMVVSSYGLQLLDASGALQGSVTWQDRTPLDYAPIGFTDQGYVVATWDQAGNDEVLLFNPLDLHLRAVGRMDPAPPGAPLGHGVSSATQTREGALVRTRWTTVDGAARSEIAWFAVPGTVSAERVLRDGFEP